MNKKGFTLVELIVVITILAILGTIAFTSLIGYSNDAENSKIKYDAANLNSAMQVKLSKGENLEDLVIIDRTQYNSVSTGSTINSGTLTLGNLEYGVGRFNFSVLKLNGESFKYNDRGTKRDYLFSYVKTPNRLNYEFAGQVFNQAGKYNVVINGNYVQYSSSDTIGLISESGSLVGLKNGDTLTGSLW